MPNTGIYKKVPLAAIKVGDRFRKEYHNIESLADSIKNRMLYPVILNKNYELCEGGRRLEAVKLLGWDEIPALIREETEEIDLRELELLGNLEREDFTWVEHVALVRKIHELHMQKDSTWSGRKTAARLNRSKSHVAAQLVLAQRLEELPELKECKTESEAQKILNKMEETIALNELAIRKKRNNAEAREIIQRSQELLAGTNRKHKSASTNNETKEESPDENVPEPDPIVIQSDGYIVTDFFDAAKKFPDGFLGSDSIIECDPPYGINLGYQKKLQVEEFSSEYEEVNETSYPAFLQTLISECYRLMGERSTLIFWFGIQWYAEVISALDTAGFLFNKIPALWIKSNFQGQTNSPQVLMANQYETFIHARKGQALLNKPGRPNIFNHSPVHSSKKIHPTERPVELIQEILNDCAIIGPNTKCCVPFLGSGATLLACKNLGIDAFGFDLSEQYRNKYLLRIEEEP